MIFTITASRPVITGKQLTKLLNGSVSTPRQLQRDVDSPTLTDGTAVGMQ